MKIMLSSAAGPTPSHAQGGMTLLELMVSSSILAGLSMGATVFFRGTADSMGSSVENAQVRNQAESGIETLYRDLAMSAPQHITVDDSDPDHDVVEIQVPVEVNAAGPVWGAIRVGEDTAATPGPGTSTPKISGGAIRYRVFKGKLLRELLDAEGDVIGRPKVVMKHVDSRRLGRKGFKVSRKDATNLPQLYSVQVRAAGGRKSKPKLNHVGTTVRSGKVKRPSH